MMPVPAGFGSKSKEYTPYLRAQLVLLLVALARCPQGASNAPSQDFLTGSPVDALWLLWCMHVRGVDDKAVQWVCGLPSSLLSMQCILCDSSGIRMVAARLKQTSGDT